MILCSENRVSDPCSKCSNAPDRLKIWYRYDVTRNKADWAAVGALMTETIPLTPHAGKPDNPEGPGSRLPLRLIDLILIVALAVGALMAFRLLLRPSEVTTATVAALLIGQNAVLLAIIWLV